MTNKQDALKAVERTQEEIQKVYDHNHNILYNEILQGESGRVIKAALSCLEAVIRDMEVEGLKPCPFCGSKPIVMDGYDYGAQKAVAGHGTICCENDVCGVNPSLDYYNGRAQGEYVWNTRQSEASRIARDFVQGGEG